MVIFLCKGIKKMKNVSCVISFIKEMSSKQNKNIKTSFKNDIKPTEEYIVKLIYDCNEKQTHIDSLLEYQAELKYEIDAIHYMYKVLYEEFEKVMKQSESKQNYVSIKNNTKHKKQTHTWTEEEINSVISKEFKEKNGEWSEDVEGTLHEMFDGQIRMKDIWERWENCRQYEKESSRHSWTEEELRHISQEFKDRKGEWSEDVEGTLHEAFGGNIRTHAIWARWENCRYLKTGQSEYKNASALHRKVWKKLFHSIHKSAARS